MKKLMIHFFQTILLVATVAGVALLPGDPSLKYANMVIFGLVGLLLVGIGLYLYRGYKKGLFCGVVFILAIGMSGVAIASCPKLSEADKQEYRNQMDKYFLNFCGIRDGFDAEKMVKSGLKMTKGDYDNYHAAVSYYGAWERAAAACATDDSWFFKSDEQEQRDCAKDFMDDVAKYMELTAEAAMKTVYALLDNEKSSCWPCGIAHVMVDSIEKVCLAVEDVFKDVAMQLLGIMLLFWILIKVLLLIGQFGTASNAEFFTELLKRCLLAMIAAAFLSFPMTEVYKMTVSPLIEATAILTEKFAEFSGSSFTGTASGGTSQGIGSRLMGNDDSMLGATCDCCNVGNQQRAIQADQQADAAREKGSREWKNTSISDCNGGRLGGQVNSILTFNAKRELMCMSCAVYKQTAPMVAAGRVLIYDATHASSVLGTIARWLLKTFSAGMLDKFPYPIGMWFTGMALAICFTLLGWTIAFRIIDIFVRIGFVIIITPFLVVTYVFPISRQYTQRGWEFLVYALISILALSIGMAFVMSILTTSLSPSVVSGLQGMMPKPDNTNKYACNLYRVWIGLDDIGSDCDYKNPGAGTFMPLFVVVILTLFGMKILKSTTVIVEGLTGITCGIPSISGAAVAAAIKASLAPVRMAAAVAAERLNRVGNPASNSKPAGGEDGEKKGVFAKLSKYTTDKADNLEHAGESAGKGVETAGKAMENTGKVMEKAGSAVEKGGQAAGTVMDTAGKGTTKAGSGLMNAGAGLSSTGLGAIAGVPLMIAGAAVAGAGLGMQAAGIGVKVGSKVAGKTMKAAGKVQQKVGKATQKVGKAMNKVGKVVNKGARVAAKGLRAVGKGAAKMQRGVDKLKAVPRNIANRMKQALPPSARKGLSNIKNLPKNLKNKFMKKTRRARAAMKYAKRKMGIHDKPKTNRNSGGGSGGRQSGQPGQRNRGRDMLVNMLDKVSAGIDKATESIDNNFGAGTDMGYAATPEANSGQATELGWKPPQDSGE